MVHLQKPGWRWVKPWTAAAACGAMWAWEMQDMVTELRAWEDVMVLYRNEDNISDNDIQSVSAIPCTSSLVRLPSFQGAWELTDLGNGLWHSMHCSHLPQSISSGIIQLELGQKESLGPWKATTDNTGGKHRLWGHLDSGCAGDTPVVLVTTAKGLRKLHLILCLWLKPIAGSASIFGDSNKVFSKDEQMNVTFIINGNTVYKTI